MDSYTIAMLDLIANGHLGFLAELVQEVCLIRSELIVRLLLTQKRDMCNGGSRELSMVSKYTQRVYKSHRVLNIELFGSAPSLKPPS